MKPHRVFIAINLPEETEDQLLTYKEKWPELPARWSAKDNLHITLAFLGNASDQELAEVCELTQGIGERHKPFTVGLEKIVYGPFDFAQDKPPDNPRMIWTIARKSPELLNVQKDIEKTLGQHDNKPFSPHLTLARLKAFELRRMEQEELPEIAQELSLSFPVQSIEVMESNLKRSGAQYTTCQSIPLQKDQ